MKYMDHKHFSWHTLSDTQWPVAEEHTYIFFLPPSLQPCLFVWEYDRVCVCLSIKSSGVKCKSVFLLELWIIHPQSFPSQRLEHSERKRMEERRKERMVGIWGEGGEIGSGHNIDWIRTSISLMNTTAQYDMILSSLIKLFLMRYIYI